MPHPEGTRLRDPSSLFYQTDYNRRLIIASYWIVIIIAIPLWWHTTSIERLSLPTSRVYSQVKNELRFPIQIQLESTGDASLPELLQNQLNDRIRRSPQAWKGFDVTVHNHHDASELIGSYSVKYGTDTPLASKRQLIYPVRVVPMLADALSSLLVPPADEHRVAQYSPRYRLAFTLLNEDAATGKAISGWDISGAISRHLSPILNTLSVLHNFTIESQVQFYAPLAFTPLSINEGYGITPEDLTVFVNSAEWSLSSSISNDPVLHFILFIPSAWRRPLQILDAHGSPSPSDAFLLPQWGGIIIYNPPPEMQSHIQLPSSALDSVFSTFAYQLLSHDWQLDALLRRRALENAKGALDTLKSIVKLVDQIENMPVGQYVKGDVQDSLTALDQMYTSAPSSLNQTLYQSANALTLASRAFFNPGMLALLYFPAEHQYAVYTPLFASAAIPLMAAAIREISAWRKQRREAVQRVVQ
ncbi:phosphatidylinositol-glycan biosynthesis class S protein-domain-containing protein [Mycena sp. CBHHK59/15]|nr:phosphatidylinositol-glycan biosynthesis class S protein-domain-containing protein [Mycena sp. CBHHK59/15]